VTRFFVRRLILSIFVIAGVLVITFFITRVLPPDPARLMVGGERATEEAIEAARQPGLDQPVVVQFARYISQVATGDRGESYGTHRSVVTDIAAFLPATVELIVPALVLAIVVGLPIGLLAGQRARVVPGGRPDERRSCCGSPGHADYRH
jgi:peptide/nickel transport system permease protein